jgi:ribose transport system substrate-binding protein
MKKRITWASICVLVIVVLIASISFSGCKTAATTETAAEATAAATTAAATTAAATTAAAETTAAAKPIRIVHMTVMLDHPYWRAQDATIVENAKEMGVELTTLNATNDATLQASQVDTVVLQKPDAVIFTAVDTGAGVALIKKMRDAGIHVVSNNRPILEGDIELQIVIDPIIMGMQSAQAFVDGAIEKYGKEKGDFLEIQGLLSDDNVTQWDLGFHQVFDKYPDMKLEIKNCEWDLVKATQEVTDAFTANPNWDGIWTQSDYLIPAVTPIVKDYPLSGEDGHVFWVSHSGDEYALEQVNEGFMDVTINMPVNDMAAISLDYAIKLVKGEEIVAGEVTQEGAKWSPSEIKEGPTGLQLFLASWPVTKADANDPNLWGNKFATGGE